MVLRRAKHFSAGKLGDAFRCVGAVLRRTESLGGVGKLSSEQDVHTCAFAGIGFQKTFRIRSFVTLLRVAGSYRW